MDRNELKKLAEIATEALKPLSEGPLRLRIADIRQPEGKDPVVTLSLNGATVEMPKPITNALGRVDAWFPGATRDVLSKHGIRVGSIVDVKIGKTVVSVREVEGKEDPLTGTKTGGGIYADATAQLEKLFVVETPKLFTEMLAAGPLVTPASA